MAAGCLRAYPWPGNVGELKNLISQLAMFATRDRIVLDDLPLDIRLAGEVFQTPEGERIPDTLMEAEKILARRALVRANGSIVRAAEILGLGEDQLDKVIQRYAISLIQDQDLQLTA